MVARALDERLGEGGAIERDRPRRVGRGREVGREYGKTLIVGVEIDMSD